jgi:hypothetical protein
MKLTSSCDERKTTDYGRHGLMQLPAAVYTAVLALQQVAYPANEFHVHCVF